MSYNYMPKSSIVIPLKNSSEDEIIEIDFSELPDGEEVLQILKGEKAALHYWLDLALEYYNQGYVDDFVKILEQSGDEAGLDYPEYEKDQMRALDMLAAYYVLQGNKERNKEKRKEWFTRATLLYTAADKIIMYDQSHLLGRAYFCLLEGNKVEQADAQFNFVINEAKNQPQSADGSRVIPAMMGKACIAFNRKEYKVALSNYKRCLKQNPNCPADVRVGMGYCFARLGYMDKAKLAFERAIQIDPTNVPSIIALAVLELNSGTPEGIRNGIQALGQAYHREPENPMVLNHLANHFFYKQDIEKTHNLASVAHQLADNDSMRAESMYHLARCYHKKQDYHHAFQFYYQATTLTHPKFVLPFFGLGQIHIYREEYENAITVFEKVLKMAPNDFDTLAVLGSLYTNVAHKDPKINAERREKAKEYLSRVVDNQTDKPPVEALIELAQLQEGLDPQASLSLYLRVATVLKEEIEVDIPAEILNNIGSLYFMLNQLDESKQYFQEARNCILAEGVENLHDEAAALLITVSYNLGRVNEQLCLYDEAEKFYRSIIRQRPNYMDCILRLGCLVRNKGDLHNATLLFKESISVNPNNPDPWTLLGNMHMSKEEWGPAQKKFEHILKLTNQTDAYSFVAMGNIWLEMLFSAKTHEKDVQHRDRAIAFYAKALKLRPHNIWAANGIGCVLAHKGNFMDARDIFSQVREATADFPDVWINVAHIYMEQKQYVSALQMYKNCMTKFGRQNDVKLSSYIARAYWKAGKFAECRDCIEKIMIEEPDRLIYRFNHAVILQKMATNALKDEKSNLEAVTSAVEDLNIAERTFKHIAATPPEIVARAKYISRTVCANEAQSCMDLLKQAQTYLQRAQAKDEEERRQKELQDEQRRRLMAKQAEEERRRQEERLMELEKLKQLRQQFVDKTKEILKLPQIREEKRVRVVGRKRREGEAEDFVNDSSDLGEFEDEELRMAAKAKKRRHERNEASPDSEEDEALVERRRRKAKVVERRRRDRALDEQVPARLRGKIKSKAYLSSSSSSSSSGAPSPVPSEGEKSGDEQQQQRKGSEEGNESEDNAEEREDKSMDTDNEKAGAEEDVEGSDIGKAGSEEDAEGSEVGKAGSEEDAEGSEVGKTEEEEDAEAEGSEVGKAGSGEDAEAEGSEVEKAGSEEEDTEGSEVGKAGSEEDSEGSNVGKAGSEDDAEGSNVGKAGSEDDAEGSDIGKAGSETGHSDGVGEEESNQIGNESD